MAAISQAFCMCNGSAYKTTHECVRRRRGYTKPPGKQVPYNGGYDTGKNDFQRYKFCIYPFGWNNPVIILGSKVNRIGAIITVYFYPI